MHHNRKKSKTVVKIKEQEVILVKIAPHIFADGINI